MSDNVKGRTRPWTFIVWEESAVSDWLDILRSLHIPGAVSPKHDRDQYIDEEGNDHAKPHWHVILNFDGVKTYNQVKEITDRIMAQYPVKVDSIGGMTRYLIHADENGTKAYYNRDEIISLSGYDVDFYFDLPKSKVSEIFRNIGYYVVDHDITQFADLVEYALYNEPDWYYVISQVSTFFVTSFIKSRHQRKYKSLAGIQIDSEGEVNYGKIKE